MSIEKKQAEQLMLAIKGGSDLNTATHYAGLSNAQVYRWLERGKIEAERRELGDTPKKEEQTFLDFWEDLRKARADAVMRNVAHIQKAAQSGEWQAAKWWLERSVPDVYGKSSSNAKSVTSSDTPAITQE